MVNKNPLINPLGVGVVDNIKIRRLSEKTPLQGVYILLKSNKIVYVGWSSNCYRRILSHLHDKKDFNLFSIIPVEGVDSLFLEQALIGILRPKYNKVNSYVTEARFTKKGVYSSLVGKRGGKPFLKKEEINYLPTNKEVLQFFLLKNQRVR